MHIPALTRRRFVAGMGIGATSAVVLAACGESESAAPAAAAPAAAPAATAAPAAASGGRRPRPQQLRPRRPLRPRPQRWHRRENVEIRFVTDHTAGPRGAAMQWGLARFAEKRPDIFVKLEPAANLIDSLAIQFAAGTAPHVALLSQSDFLRFHEEDAFTEITDELAKRDDFVPEDYYFLPDAYTFNNIDHSFPQPELMTGPQYGMPFQFAISGFVANISLAENAGVTLPDSDGGWTWDDWTEWDAMMTDPDTGAYGTWARDDYEFQYMPQMYSNGMAKPFDDTFVEDDVRSARGRRGLGIPDRQDLQAQHVAAGRPGQGARR